MTDELARAVSALSDCSVAVVCGEFFCRKTGRGIGPVLELIETYGRIDGCRVADKIVGKAAALLFVKLGASEVYGSVMSRRAAEVLRERGIVPSYESLCEEIVNRQGTGCCPMERTVEEIDDPETAFSALREAVRKLKKDAEVQ